MAKISIKQKPTFTRPVEIPQIGGKPVKVNIEFKFLSRSEVSALIQTEIEQGKKFADLMTANGSTMIDVTEQSKDFQVEYLQKIMVGWEFEEEFNEENVRALVSTYVAVPDAIIAAYKASYEGAREGN
ncbi:phage tail assembly chaperone [uncultured Pseudomonas sp.]|uniref:phage tail assembly chaperone n=1 Tax=uncultured Pseudomonas sp. TaxID=114707 RepID=UPI002585BBFC|nr:phage tail assembly chaperone [uncultured Pseudomonas sp.]